MIILTRLHIKLFVFKNFGISEMVKRIVSPDAGWDDDFGDLPEWLQDWGNNEFF